MRFGIAHENLRPMMGSLRSVGMPAAAIRGEGGGGGGGTNRSFITISRQAGAPAHALGKLLVERLNQGESDPANLWQCLDRELVEKIASDHHLSTDLIESLERSSHTWIEEFFSGLSRVDKDRPSELSIFRRVVQTMRALAQGGNVILIGLGGAYVTRDMPGGLHLRLVAPVEWRVKNMAKLHGISEDEARKLVNLYDHDRVAFIHKFWPHLPLSDERFHMTLNGGLLSDEQMADAALPLIRAQRVVGMA